MGYSVDSSMVRVDLFKPSGKWFTTVALRWDRYRTGNPQDGSNCYEDIKDTFRRCMRMQYMDIFNGMTAVCLHPYHEHEHPLMITIPDDNAPT